MEHILTELKDLNRKIAELPQTYTTTDICRVKEKALKASIQTAVLEEIKGLVSYKHVAVIATVALLLIGIYSNFERVVDRKIKTTEGKIIGHINKDSTDVGVLLASSRNFLSSLAN